MIVIVVIITPGNEYLLDYTRSAVRTINHPSPCRFAQTVSVQKPILFCRKPKFFFKLHVLSVAQIESTSQTVISAFCSCKDIGRVSKLGHAIDMLPSPRTRDSRV